MGKAALLTKLEQAVMDGNEETASQVARSLIQPFMKIRNLRTLGPYLIH